MAFIDKQNYYSEDQAITTTAVSTNAIDHGLAGIGEGEGLELIAQVTADFAGGTSIAVSLQTDSDENFGTVETVFTTAAIATASLVAGYKFKVGTLPAGLSRHTRLNYTVVGTMTAGTLSAWVGVDRQTA